MVSIKKKEEIKILKEGGKILAHIMEEISQKAAAGVSASQLDEMAERTIKRYGGEPSFKNYKPKGSKGAYPFSLCVSLNDEVVHGLPLKDKIIKAGDIVSLDLGMRYKGMYVDMALTLGIGEISQRDKNLIDTTRNALAVGIGEIREGATVGDIGFAIQNYVEERGFVVVKKLVGHGVGYSVHEEPEIPNYGERGRGVTLKEGMVLALEPMVNVGTDDVFLSDDGWAWRTSDGLPSAHFEHTVAVGKDGGEILTRL